MPSPFSGMDPYIEGQGWAGFHTQFISQLQRILAPLVRPQYLVFMDEHLRGKAEVERQVYLEVRRRDTGRVVCVLEMLSPIHKAPGLGQQEYLAKRAAYLQSAAHLVEIDLLRGGERLPMREPLPPAAYYVFVSHADLRPDCGVWPIQLQDRLPTIPVPLSNGSNSVLLDLQSAFEQVYDAAAYADLLDYGHDPDPPLSAEDTAWAGGWLSSF